MLEDLRVRQRRMATRPLLTAPERAVQVQHHVAEHVAHQQQPQKVITEELQHTGFYELRDCGSSYVDIEYRERFDLVEKDDPRMSVLFLIRDIKVNAHISFFWS